MVRIAVTGGIACGKSRLALYLQSCHIPILEADEVAHIALAQGTNVYKDVVSEFGIVILDASGGINRSKLADIVFGNEAKLDKLNSFVHPIVKREIDNWLEAEEKKGETQVVAIIPLLYESGMDCGWDAIIAVGCFAEIQRERLMKRGLNETLCRQIIASQMSVEEKMKNSEFTIWNNEDEVSFEKKIDNVLKTIQERQYGRRE